MSIPEEANYLLAVCDKNGSIQKHKITRHYLEGDWLVLVFDQEKLYIRADLIAAFSVHPVKGDK